LVVTDRKQEQDMKTSICGIPQFVMIEKCGIVFKAKKVMGEIYCRHGKDK
jgi:hypothetical protein